MQNKLLFQEYQNLTDQLQALQRTEQRLLTQSRPTPATVDQQPPSLSSSIIYDSPIRYGSVREVSFSFGEDCLAFSDQADSTSSAYLPVFADEASVASGRTLTPAMAISQSNPSTSSGRVSPSFGSSPRKPRLVKVFLPFDQHSMVCCLKFGSNRKMMFCFCLRR